MSNVGDALPDGTSAIGTRTKTCPVCLGGKVVTGPQKPGMATKEMVQCPKCGGSGQIPKGPWER